MQKSLRGYQWPSMRTWLRISSRTLLTSTQQKGTLSPLPTLLTRSSTSLTSTTTRSPSLVEPLKTLANILIPVNNGITRRFIEYSKQYSLTLHCEQCYHFTSLQVFRYFPCKLPCKETQVWDTAGQERYQSLGVAFYKGTDCCVLVYDVTNPASFDALDNWKSEFLRQAGTKTDKFPFVVLGNKCEQSNEHKVASSKAQTWCKANEDLPFFEVSAKEQTNVTEAFEMAAKLALDQHTGNITSLKPEKKAQPSQKLSRDVAKKEGCGCQ